MAETIGLTTRSGLTFTADVAGPAGGPLVLLLHGFPESRHSWREALPVLAKAGYRVRDLIAYGEAWYPWYMRRLAERPANVLFALRQLLP